MKFKVIQQLEPTNNRQKQTSKVLGKDLTLEQAVDIFKRKEVSHDRILPNGYYSWISVELQTEGLKNENN